MTNWKTYKIGDLCKISSSKRIFAKEYKDSGIPFYRGKEIIEKQKGNKISTELYISQERYDEIKAKHGVPQMGDMLLTSVGTLGIPYIVQDEVFYFKDGNLTWFYNFEGLDSRYLYYWFLSPIGKMNIDSKAIGSTQKALTIETLSKFEVSLPPLEEQRRIVGILSAIDDKIENNRRINTNLELQAQALYKQWFVDNRNDDWEVGKVSDYYDITIGKTPPRKEKQWFSNNPKDSVWVSISDMGSCGAYISDSSEYLTTKAVDKFNIKVVPNNTVLLSFKLTVGRVAISDGAMTTNEAIAHFNTLNDYLTEYTYLALKAYNFANLGSTSSIATAVNSKIIKSMLWVMPNDNVLRDFHNIVAPIFTQIKNNIRENETLASLSDTLLPKLMSGELKISEYEIHISR